jgi:hypothetical protein
MSVAPPSKKRPTWKADTIVEPFEKVSGSTSVACWLVVFTNGSWLIGVTGTLALATAGSASSSAATSSPASLGAPRLTLPTVAGLEGLVNRWI